MSLLDAWTKYRERCIHPEASSLQVRQTKIAFYLGALYAVDLLNQMRKEGRRSPEAIHSLIDEISRFRDGGWM